MSVLSGVFIKYVVEFPVAPGAAGALAAAAAAAPGVLAAAGASLKVSNDVLAGDFCIDADISVKMHRWDAGSEFEIKLYDLPEAKVTALEETLKSNETAAVKISLGYFDTNDELVLDGIYVDVNRDVAGDQLVTTIKGQEKAFFACTTTKYTGSLRGDKSYKAAIGELLSQAQLPEGCSSTEPQVNDNLPAGLLSNLTFRDTVLLSINDLAKRANAEFLIADGKVFFGAPILNNLVETAQLDFAVNLAKFDPITKKMLSTESGDSPDINADIKGFTFTVVGDPKMRPGQRIVVNDIDKYKSPEFRIRHVEHAFSSSAGYRCIGAATEQIKNGETARWIDSKIDHSAGAALKRLTDGIRSRGVENPVIEVGAVKSAGAGYRSSLYYGQPAPGNETQPSINAAIKQQDDHVYEDKPIASPFAWRKCGLVTPLYPGMKAVVVHNRAQASDAIVTGYVWSKQPDFPPPPNQGGDWWLCLPIDFDSTQPPDDSTKAVNDITASNGCRVIELKGLKITVGAAGLKEIGKRPDPEDSKVAEACTIAHASGAVITIQNGEIDVDTGIKNGPKLTLSSAGITFTDGKLNVQLANGKLAVG